MKDLVFWVGAAAIAGVALLTLTKKPAKANYSAWDQVDPNSC